MTQWLTGFLTALGLAIFGYVLNLQKCKRDKLDEQLETVAALRYELQSNLGWLDDILESKIFLRDEAWAALKSKGYISFLPKPIPMAVIAAYEKTHLLNHRIKLFRDVDDVANTEQVRRATIDAQNTINELIVLLDRIQPKLGRNFRV